MQSEIPAVVALSDEHRNLLEALRDGEDMITVIGRGHTGTRAAARIVRAWGVRLGSPLNGSEDLTPSPNPMYRAARIAAERVRVYRVDGRIAVDMTRLAGPPPSDWIAAVLDYLQVGGLIGRDGLRGWKLPETVFGCGWFAMLLPRIRILYWTRDPRGAVRTTHGTDDLAEWGVDLSALGEVEGKLGHRLLSYGVQQSLMLGADRPDRFAYMSLETWATDPQAAVDHIADRLELPRRESQLPPDGRAVARGLEGNPDATPAYELARATYEQLRACEYQAIPAGL